MRQPPQQQNDIFGGSYQQPAESDIFSQPQEEMPEESAGSEDIVIEELIEGIVEEKWEKTRGDMERMGGEFSRVRAEMKSMEQRLSERREPSHDASALQALAAGKANEGQQRRALDWIMKGACALPLWPYSESQRETDIALGRHFVGQQIAGLLKINISQLAKRDERGNG